MSEQTQQPTPEAVELTTLRQAHSEVLTKRARDKDRIATLEAQLAELQTKASDAEARIKQLTVDGPVNALCESISLAPQALRNALETEYRFELREGALTILNAADGQQVMVNGKPLPLAGDAIKNFLLESKDEAKLKLYRAILIASKATGSGNTQRANSGRPSMAAKAKTHQFGLR